MLVVEQGTEDYEVEDGLIRQAEQYLIERGASVLYAGGQNPLNPFYWGIYGGSEWAGILDPHTSFHRAVMRAGYEPASTCVLLEADLTQPAPPDIRGVLKRRETHVETIEDVVPDNWWDALALGNFHLTRYRLVKKSDNAELAHATTWDMAWFSRLDGKSRVGLIEMEVSPASRRKGFGRHLVQEIFRSLRAQGTAVVSLQTNATNIAALALYEAIGFEPIGTATLYRLPGGILPRTPRSG